jgi:hypothetical protein
MEARHLGPQVEIVIKADQLPDDTLEGIATELNLHTGQTPNFTLEATNGIIRFLFAVVRKNI